MSKIDAMRAVREARAERLRAAAASGSTPTRARRPAARPPVAPEPEKPVSAAAAPGAAEALCGHRNMSGRTCTREQGHAAKSHRYS